MIRFLSALAVFSLAAAPMPDADNGREPVLTLNRKDTGYRGIWYMNEPLRNEYRFKYSGFFPLLLQQGRQRLSPAPKYDAGF